MQHYAESNRPTEDDIKTCEEIAHVVLVDDESKSFQNLEIPMLSDDFSNSDGKEVNFHNLQKTYVSR